MEAAAPTRGARRSGSVRTQVVLNLLLRAALLVAVLIVLAQRPVVDADIARFSALGRADGVAYRDYPVEYAPGELAVIRLVAGGDDRVTAMGVASLAFALDVVAFAGLWFGWDEETALAYLWLGVPLLFFRYLRLWYLPVAVSVWAFALARGRRGAAGGFLFGVAAFVKVWPVALAPALRRFGRRSLEVWFAVIGLGAAAWLFVGGIDGIRQVATFRSAAGWEIESTPGSIAWVVFGEAPRLERGAVRVGDAGMATVVLGAALIAVVTIVWIVAAHADDDDLGVPAVVAVTAVVALSPLFSLQYVGWLTPWAAIAHRDDRRVPFVTTWAIVVLTAGVFLAFFRSAISLDGADASIGKAMLLARNACCLFLPTWYILSTRRDADRATRRG